MAYHTTVPTTRPALIPPYEVVTLARQGTAETVFTTKKAIVPPYYEDVTPGRQVNTERQATGTTIVPPYYEDVTPGRQIKEGELAYDYPLIAVNKQVQVVPPEDHQYEQPM